MPVYRCSDSDTDRERRAEACQGAEEHQPGRQTTYRAIDAGGSPLVGGLVRRLQQIVGVHSLAAVEHVAAEPALASCCENRLSTVWADFRGRLRGRRSRRDRGDWCSRCLHDERRPAVSANSGTTLVVLPAGRADVREHQAGLRDALCRVRILRLCNCGYDDDRGGDAYAPAGADVQHRREDRRENDKREDDAAHGLTFSEERRVCKSRTTRRSGYALASVECPDG